MTKKSPEAHQENGEENAGPRSGNQAGKHHDTCVLRLLHTRRRTRACTPMGVLPAYTWMCVCTDMGVGIFGMCASMCQCTQVYVCVCTYPCTDCEGAAAYVQRINLATPQEGICCLISLLSGSDPWVLAFHYAWLEGEVAVGLTWGVTLRGH